MNMLMNSSLRIAVVRNITLPFFKRNYLSAAFDCTDAWNSRLSHRIFQNVNSESMFYEIDSQYTRNRKINAIDVDIFVNAQKDDTYITEVEELVHKLRRSNQTHNQLPTTCHGFVRLFIQYKSDELLRILDDRLNYGLFPDTYLIIFLLNKYLKRENYRNAAKVAALQMLQEDFSNDLLKYMSLYSVLKYLETDIPWEDVVEVDNSATNEDEEKEVKIRVRVLRNPFFDDHFDLKDGNHLCGKTLSMISNTMPDNMKGSIKLLGLALYNKWDLLLNHLENIKDGDQPMFLDCLNRTKCIIKMKLNDNDTINKIQEIMSSIESKKLVEENLMDLVEKMVIGEVSASESQMIQNQIELYSSWEKLRDDKLEEKLNEIERMKKLKEIQRKKEELKQREELLYFFDNEDDIDLCIEQKELKKETNTYRYKGEPVGLDYLPKGMLKAIAKRKKREQSE